MVLRSPKAQAFSVSSVSSLRDLYDAYRATFGPESVLPVAETAVGRIGMLVENEICVPEAARLLAARGAEIILHPTLESDRSNVPGPALKQAAAFANGVYLVSATGSRLLDPRPGQPAGVFGCQSLIVGPNGAILAAVGPAEGVATALVSSNAVAAARLAHGRETTPATILYRHLYAGSRLWPE